MKEYRKTKSVQVGVKGDLQDLLEYLYNTEVSFENSQEVSIWYISDSDKITLKYKGKNIEAKDIQVFIEEVDQ